VICKKLSDFSTVILGDRKGPFFTLSFDAVLKKYDRIRQRIAEESTEAAYSFVSKRLKAAQALFNKWLDIYELYARGYATELLTFSYPAAILSLDEFDRVLEDRRPKVFGANISSEAYVLVDDLFANLGYDSDLYVLAEGDSFEKKSVYTEVNTESLKNLTKPVSKKTEIEKTLKHIQNRDISFFYYDGKEYDNALAWPLLLHECLHYLYYTQGLHQLQKRFASVSWAQEALIDIYVTNFFGPAYAVSLANYLYRRPHEAAISYPDFAVRLYISSLYLSKLEEMEKLPESTKHPVKEASDYIKKVLNQYEGRVSAFKKDADEIVEETNRPINEIISKKTQPFVDFVRQTEFERKEAYKVLEKKYLRKEVLSISDVLEYYENGLPVAADPRILFNSFISRKYLMDELSMLFFKESLKKWYVKKAWVRSELDVKSKS